MPCTSVCRGRESNCNWVEYMLLFKAGRRLSAKVEAAL